MAILENCQDFFLHTKKTSVKTSRNDIEKTGAEIFKHHKQDTSFGSSTADISICVLRLKLNIHPY